MSVSQKAINTLIIAPLIGMAVLTVQPVIIGGDAAYAQTNGRATTLSRATPTPTTPTPNNPGVNPGDPDRGSSSTNRKPRTPPCPVGAAPTPNCRPWTPPTQVVQSADECRCELRRVNGRLIKDCYVMLRDLVHYCNAGSLQRK